MKRKSVTIVSMVLALLLSLSLMMSGCFGGCFDGNNDDSKNTEPQTYTIQYSDDAGTHTLTVTEGMPYSLESVPYKFGYEFLGLFDAQTGGTQYVGANGASLSPYTDKENKVLFPQFKPIDYTVILDYGEAKVTGDRSLTVAYNANLPELPKNLTLAHNEFTGWYTEANGKGTQVADAYGNLPGVSILNEENFKLDDTKRVYLYAGFKLETYTVTFYFDAGMEPEEVEVPYNTPISQVVPKTRNSKGEAGLVWSTVQADTEKEHVFDGRITGEKVLYIAEWAPVIELNVNGGDEITPVVARAGSTISLPTPTKSLAKFLRWETVDGDTANYTKMPEESTTLKAIWQAKIEFDENGGTEVDDISKPAGESITLPTLIRDGYIFAGWYTKDKERYSQTEMPAEGVALKAGWYKSNKKTITIVENNFDNKVRVDDKSFSTSRRWKIDLADILKYIPSDGVTIDYVIHYRWAGVMEDYSATAALALYEGSELNSSYQLKNKSLSHSSDNNTYIRDSFSGESVIHTNVLYLYYYGSQDGKWSTTNYVAFYDVYIDLTYPDTTYLYL